CIAHIDPDCSRGDAVKHEQCTHRMRCIGHTTQIIIGKQYARSSFNVSSKDQIRFFAAYGLDHFFYGWRSIRGLWARLYRAWLETYFFGRNLSGLNDLRTTIAEPAIADDDTPLSCSKLPGHRLHAKSTAAGHHNGGIGTIDGLQCAGDILHDVLKGGRHMVQ